MASSSNPSSNFISSFEILDFQIPPLQSRLRHQLPHSIPLYRRIQFHQRHPNPPHAKIFVAFTGGDPTSWLAHSHDGEPSWLAAHIDLSTPGQSQVWMFASWEADYNTTTTAAAWSSTLRDRHSRHTSHTEDFPARKALFDTLTTYIRTTLIPLRPEQPAASWLDLKRAGKWLSTPYRRSKVLFAALHQECVGLIDEGSVSRKDAGYLKYIFRVDPKKEDERDILEGFRISSLEGRHLQMVLDRNPIPRTLETLASYVNAGVWRDRKGEGEGEPIAWGFLGKDASLTSLHTEPECRGRGIAVVLGTELFARMGGEDAFPDESDGEGERIQWGHADVSESNVGSRRVMEKLGGVVMSRVGWVEIDLEKDVDRERKKDISGGLLREHMALHGLE